MSAVRAGYETAVKPQIFVSISWFLVTLQIIFTWNTSSYLVFGFCFSLRRWNKGLNVKFERGNEFKRAAQSLYSFLLPSLSLSLIAVGVLTRSIWWSPGAAWATPCDWMLTGWGGMESHIGSLQTGRRGWQGLLWRRNKPWWGLWQGGRWGPGGGLWYARTCLNR